MIKQTIKYEDFNGEAKTKDAYFHMSRFELNAYDAKWPGGITKYLPKLLESKDGEKLYEFIVDLIMACYGEKTSDGQMFIKSQEAKDRFRYSPAFDEFCMDFLEHPEKIDAFLRGALPKANTSPAAVHEAHH